MTIVFLHIGIHKTGTSSIQETLALNRPLLAARGLLFPAALPSNHSHFVHDALSDAPELYHANRSRGFDRVAISARTAVTMERLREEIAAARPRALILSAEDASSLTDTEVERVPGFLAHLTTDAEVRVVLYTRHPIDYVESAIQENVRGNGLTLQRARTIHLGASENRYRRLVARWGRVFGEAAITVRSMERAARRHVGLVGDVLEVLGVPRARVREVRRNEGTSDEIVRFLDERNIRSAPPLQPADLARLAALKGNRGSLLDEQERRTVWHRSATDRAYLTERWGVRYGRPTEWGDEVTRAARHEAFRVDLAAILPDLGHDLASELAAHFAIAGHDC